MTDDTVGDFTGHFLHPFVDRREEDRDVAPRRWSRAWPRWHGYLVKASFEVRRFAEVGTNERTHGQGVFPHLWGGVLERRGKPLLVDTLNLTSDPTDETSARQFVEIQCSHSGYRGAPWEGKGYRRPYASLCRGL